MRAMFTLQEVEARGDAAEGIGIIDAFLVGPDGETFWSLERMRELSQVADFGPLLPGWTYSRWTCNQAFRAMHQDARGRVLRAMELAGRHARPDRDWVCRQQLVFELGGLDFFVRRMAASTLLARADQVDTWPQARMGGFRFVASTPSTTTWEDLDSGECVSMPNIGSSVLLQPGDLVIGRLVPVEAGLMFDSRPLHVPATVAKGVARDPLRWAELPRSARPSRGGGGLLEPTVRESVVSDVPTWVWQLALLDPELLDPGDDPEELPTYETMARAVLDAAAIELELLEHPRPAPELDRWPCLGAALLEPGLWGVLPSVVAPRDQVVLRELGDVIAEPAAAVCRRVARELFDAA